MSIIDISNCEYRQKQNISDVLNDGAIIEIFFPINFFIRCIWYFFFCFHFIFFQLQPSIELRTQHCNLRCKFTQIFHHVMHEFIPVQARFLWIWFGWNIMLVEFWINNLQLSCKYMVIFYVVIFWKKCKLLSYLFQWIYIF